MRRGFRASRCGAGGGRGARCGCGWFAVWGVGLLGGLWGLSWVEVGGREGEVGGAYAFFPFFLQAVEVLAVVE